jgi:predicted RecB family nuclease
MITNDTFVNFLHCSRKAFLKASGSPGELSDIERIEIDSERIYQRQALEVFLARVPESDVIRDPVSLEAALRCRPRVIVNTVAQVENMQAQIQALERVEDGAGGKLLYYMPVLFRRENKVSRFDKLQLGFNALILSRVQGVLPRLAKLVHGDEYRTLKVKVEAVIDQVRSLIDRIAASLAEAHAARVSLNRHCNVCEFRDGCRQLAIEADDLSLLRGLSEKEIEKHRSRGITTVAQFSYTYRPGRRGKRKSTKMRKHDHALQALAVREKKVYILDTPTIPRAGTALYLDVEGVPDRDFYYLIGLVAAQEASCTTYSFWADDASQEKVNWDACAKLIDSFGDYTLYHYGRYEQRFLDRMQKLLSGEAEAAAINRIRARSCNILAAIYSHIYFPTWSNGLKDIGGYLGATWSARHASGIQSLAWRLSWEVSHEESLKCQLLRYNLEDCQALRQITEFLFYLCAGAPVAAEQPGVVVAEHVPQPAGFHFGKTEFFCPELATINRCAYADYQRDKVYLRTCPSMRRSLARKRRAAKKRLRVNEQVECGKPEVCPECGASQIHVFGRHRYSKVVCDLKFTSSGVKRWLVRYSTLRYRCWVCRKSFFADAYRAVTFRSGRNLCAWVIYHHVALRQSYEDVNLSLNEIFGFTFVRPLLTRIKPWMAAQHKATFDRLKANLRQGSLIHVDETKVLIKGHTGYVWAFTNMEEVAYVYTPTREGTILDDLLEGFTGVLVSDFYAAYDAPKCLQQKCLIHLIRDINDDIFHNPFDEELKELARRFVAVLKPIIDTVDRYGLKQYHLNRHKADVARYYRYLSGQDFQSEVARKYQNRLQKYQDKLFVFLDHDGIPWNNNNAENAIKRFAGRRKIIGASFTERGIQDYLLFLSIYQTCRHKNIRFLHFLRSGKSDLEDFAGEKIR